MKRSSSTLLLVPAIATVPACAAAQTAREAQRPNIILIMADDMGYSDVGCFGGEIPTPNIDRLAASGIRYTQFYNTGRSCPTRASLLTGLYSHQAGIGAMSEDPYDKTKHDTDRENHGLPGYMGHLNRNCVTIAEVMKQAGYNTYMVGKWHLGMHGMEKWPLQRGFDRYYGILSGAASYLRPQGMRGLTLDNSELPPPRDPYYTTDAFTDHAIEFLKSGRDDDPFFLYVAYNAPHWPLQAKDADIEKFIGKYDAGWEAVREARHKRMIELGIVDGDWKLAEWESRGWEELTEEERRHSALRMSVYAAQVHCMDRNVGRIIDYLEDTGQRDNTLVVFFSDNGACAEPHSETGFGMIGDVNKDTSWVEPSYGLPWAQVSNTPLRKYKVRAYEGGISTCFVMSWPGRFARYDGEIRRNVAFLPDVMATFIDAGGTVYPETFHGGNAIRPLEGKSMLASVTDRNHRAHEYIFGEHFDNRYVRWREWKAVKDQTSDKWELYDIEADRTETTDMSSEKPRILERLIARWQEWADSHDVYPKWE